MIESVIAALRMFIAWTWTALMAVVAWVCMVVFGGDRGWEMTAPLWARIGLKIVGVRVKISGAENMRRGPAVYVCNHESLIDAVVMPAVLPPATRVVLKKELTRVPFLGWALSRSAVVVDRRHHHQAVAAIEEAASTLGEGWSVLVFPEGTRSPRGGNMLPFKRGAFHIAMKSKLPIVPVGASGARDVVPKDRIIARPSCIYLTIGEPISTVDWRAESVAEHVQEVRRAVEKLRLASAQWRASEEGVGGSLPSRKSHTLKAAS